MKAKPSDDLPRLVLADWLDEHGEPERAELIRVQCELRNGKCPTCKGEGSVLVWAQYDPLGADVYPNGYIEPCPRCGEKGELEERSEQLLEAHSSEWADVPAGVELVWERGFVSQVTCPVGTWLDRECERCAGRGHLSPASTRWSVDVPESGRCPTCAGKGARAGIGTALVRDHLVEWVGATDKRPERNDDSYWGPLNGFPYTFARRDWPDPDEYALPAPVFDRLRLNHRYAQEHFDPESHRNESVRWYEDEREVRTFLSDALLEWAHESVRAP